MAVVIAAVMSGGLSEGRIRPAAAADRHAGYYYPPPQAIETYVARAPILQGADPTRRVGFVTAIAAGANERPYPPSFIIFAKGEHMEKLIVTATRDGLFNTKYRLRAMLAQLTAVARTTPIFQEFPPEDRLTFFDLAFMMGFEQLTYTNGDDFSHQIKLVPPGADAAAASAAAAD